MAKKISPQVLREHQRFLKRVGADKAARSRDYRAPFPDYNCKREGVAECSNSIGHRIIYRKSIKPAEETHETLAEIAMKSKRVAPAYNKGATMYITPGADPTAIGRK